MFSLSWLLGSLEVGLFKRKTEDSEEVGLSAKIRRRREISPANNSEEAEVE